MIAHRILVTLVPILRIGARVVSKAGFFMREFVRMSELNPHVKAILAGVSTYNGLYGSPDLPSAGDLETMAEALIFGLGISPYRIRMNRTRGEGAGFVTKASFLEGIRLFLTDITPEDILIFYFTGHGLVKHGRHYLLFSDGPLETQSVIDLFEQLHVSRRLLFLDCCMSGEYELAAHAIEANETWIDALLDGGTAVFASSRRNEPSGYEEGGGSLFTAFLRDAMMSRRGLQNGCLTLDRIREMVYEEADAWNLRHPEGRQHPVFRSSIGGTISFQVVPYTPYPRQTYVAETEEYCVTNVWPIHTKSAKRYKVSVILKESHTASEDMTQAEGSAHAESVRLLRQGQRTFSAAIDTSQFVRISREIVRRVRDLNIYKSAEEEMRWRGHGADFIFMSFGRSEADIANGLFEYQVTWAASPADKKKWYRESAHAKIFGGFLVDRNPDYKLLRRMNEKDTANPNDIRRKTNEIMQELACRGEELVRLWQEMRNGTYDPGELREICGPLLSEVDALYLRLSELPIPPAGMAQWAIRHANLAGDVSDLAILISGSEQEDTARLDEVIRRFHQDLETLVVHRQD